MWLKDGDGGEAEWMMLFMKCIKIKVCQIVGNVKHVKNDHIPFCEKCS